MQEFKSLLTKIAWAYYMENKTQNEIANELVLNRMKVNRYLSKARELGIVKISVSMEHGYDIEKEERLKALLDIRDVTVVPGGATPDNFESTIGEAGAFRINQLLTPDDILGVAWGYSLFNVAKRLQPVKRKNGKQMEVVQLIGGLANNSRLNPEQIVKEVATRLDAYATWMNMPLIMGSKEARDILMNDASVASIFEKAKNCTVCILGLGNLSEESSLYIAGAYSKEDLRLLKEAGAVGDIMSIPIDIYGEPIKIPLTDRIIAVNLEDIKKIDKRIAIAVGDIKTKVIIGACRGGYINELITDEDTADCLIRYLEK